MIHRYMEITFQKFSHKVFLHIIPSIFLKQNKQQKRTVKISIFIPFVTVFNA